MSFYYDRQEPVRSRVPPSSWGEYVAPAPRRPSSTGRHKKWKLNSRGKRVRVNVRHTGEGSVTDPRNKPTLRGTAADKAKAQREAEARRRREEREAREAEEARRRQEEREAREAEEAIEAAQREAEHSSSVRSTHPGAHQERGSQRSRPDDLGSCKRARYGAAARKLYDAAGGVDRWAFELSTEEQETLARRVSVTLTDGIPSAALR